MNEGKNLDTRLLVSETTLTNEVWKDIVGYPYYIVSNYGRVKNKHGRILKPRLQNSGYYFYSLYDGRGRNHQKQITVHRLVMITFNGDSKLDINHVDGNKFNNHISNLEYITHSDNLKHAFKTGIHPGKKGYKYQKPMWYTMYRKLMY